MELAAQCERLQLFLAFVWVPREENLEADEFSNGISTSFRPENEVKIQLDAIPWIVLPTMLAAGEE
eukprot:9274019-Lingulodinium_polyedra.AAC.1